MEVAHTEQAINPSETSSQPIPNPVDNQKRPLAYFLLGVLVLLIVVGGGAYYLGKTSNKPTETNEHSSTVNQQPLSTTSPNTQTMSKPIPSADETANWKTYSDNKYGFSFKYPQNAVIDSVTTGDLGHYVSVKSSTLDLTVSVDSLGYDPGSLGADRVWTVIVNGITWKGRYDRANKCTSPCPAATLLDAQIKNHTIGYHFRGENVSDEMVKNYLSTFRFTNQP